MERNTRMMDAGLEEADRELLLAAVRRYLDTLPTDALVAISAAADELVDPHELPVLVAVPVEATADLPEVVRAVRARLVAAAAAAGGSPARAMACARAARHLGAAERELAGEPAR